MKKIKALKRERVNRALESIFGYPLTIVEAPMGYGKTTAVREFLADKRSPVLWLTFLSPEDTSAFFWDRLALEIGKLSGEAGAKLKSLGFPSDAPQTANILSILNELDFDENTVLVIDDFHLVKSHHIGALLKQIVKEQPDNLHIAVVTRDTTNLDITELLAKGLCNVLLQQTLRFTDSEIRSYCALMGFTPDEGELKKINEYTGGWISLTYLILLGLERGIPIERNGAINELVEKVLFNPYDESIKRFLLRLSAMDSFTAEQALFVTQEPEAEELLKKLRRENAFVAFDEATNVYKIHNVLLDFLRMKQKDDLERASLYERVGEWHLARKMFIPAYEYFCRAGETERVLAFLDEKGTLSNSQAQFEGSMAMFAATPRELLFRYPFACLQYIGLLLLSANPAEVEDGVTRLNELKAIYEQRQDIHLNLKNSVLAEISTVRIFNVFNDAQKMLECTWEASRLLEGGLSRLFEKESEFTFGCPHFLYSYYREPNRLRETVDVMVTGFPDFSRLTAGCGAGCEYVTLAEYALETGDWHTSELNAFKAIYKAKTKEQTCIVLCATLTLIRLYIFQGRVDEGLELLQQLTLEVARENNPVYNTTVELVEGYVYGCLGQLDNISTWLQTGDMSPAHFFYEGLGFNYIVYGKAVLLSKNYINLEILTEEFLRYFSILHNQLGFLHNQIFAAAAKYQLYGLEQGCAALRKAFDMAREDHIVLPFAEYAPAVMDMVRHIAYTDPRDTYIKEVLEVCGQYMESLKYSTRSIASLSARELEILTLAAEGLKRNEIAEKLYVTAGTVQTHLHNIYLKLEVGGRTAAIKKAQKLKIL